MYLLAVLLCCDLWHRATSDQERVLPQTLTKMTPELVDSVCKYADSPRTTVPFALDAVVHFQVESGKAQLKRWART